MSSGQTFPKDVKSQTLGDVEIGVDENFIWIADYKGGTHHFTFVIPRGGALDQGSRNGDFARGILRSRPNLKDWQREFIKNQEAKGGVWYETTGLPGQGGPYSVVDR